MLKTIHMSLEAGNVSRECLDVRDILSNMYLNWCILNRAERMGGPYDFTITTTEENVEHLWDQRGHHRLSRISPHDQLKRRHTSFVEVVCDSRANPPDGFTCSYTLSPFQRAVNKRTGVSTDKVEFVLAGNPNLLWGKPAPEAIQKDSRALEILRLLARSFAVRSAILTANRDTELMREIDALVNTDEESTNEQPR